MKFFDRTLADVAYPAGKVHMHDSHQRHFGPQVHYFGAAIEYDFLTVQARVPTLMFDASADVRSALDSNPGWRPSSPSQPCMAYFYAPNAWEPAATNAEPKQISFGAYRWTRAGLKGLDFDGASIGADGHGCPR